MIGLKNVFKWEIGVLILLLTSIVLYFALELVNVKEIKNIPLILAIVICGIPLIYQIVKKLYQGDLGADSLAALAVITSLFLDEYLAGTIVLLMLASGQLLESYAVRRASSVLQALAKRMPAIAHRKESDGIKDIPLHKIKIGDEILIYPHETSPVDGMIIEGRGSMDESYLTGEPYYVPKAPGVMVLSGAINRETLLIIRATHLPQDSRYAKIMKVMGEAEQRRPKLRRLSDQLGALFAPAALIWALLAWYLSGESIRFLAVLVIATPCPLLIAIPIAIISAISLAARRGIIIKDPIVLERLPTCETAIFDKTGTLTYGRAELIEIAPLTGFNKTTLLQQVASVEQFSNHPLAEAIINTAKLKKLSFLNVDRVVENPGQGLVGHIEDNEIQIISRKQFSLQYPDQTVNLPPLKSGMEAIILWNRKLAAVFYFRDVLRKEGLSFIRHLSPIHSFKKIMVVSGDRPSEVNTLAQQLGIQEVYASQTPEQKVEIVRKETAKSATLFMGDGINDAPALAIATVGLAFGVQNIIATEAAGAVILESSLSKVDELLHISALMRKTALLSAGGGILLSFIGMYFAGLGFIPPVAGAILQEGIDVIAILFALRLTWHSKILVDIK